MKFGAASAGDSGSTRIRTGANPPPVSLEMNGRAGMNCPGYDLEGSSPRASSRGGRVQFPPRTRRSSNKALLEQGAPLLGTTWNPHGSTLCGGYRRFPQVTWWLLHVGSCWVRSDNGVMKRNSQAGGVEASATLVHLGCWCAEVWKGRRFDVKGDKMLKRTNNKHQPMRAGSSRRTPILAGRTTRMNARLQTWPLFPSNIATSPMLEKGCQCVGDCRCWVLTIQSNWPGDGATLVSSFYFCDSHHELLAT
jgi:hypothetical protein